MNPTGTPYFDDRVEEPIIIVIMLKGDKCTQLKRIAGI
jgi:hypothetical protein